MSRYLWRADLTDRHRVQANDVLFDDFRELRCCLRALADRGEYDLKSMASFSLALPTEEDLVDALGWIGKSRLGKAVAAAAASSGAREWFTGVALDQTRVRELNGAGRFDFHHVFPKGVLGQLASTDPDRFPMDHGLNGVWLPKDENQSARDEDPREYVHRIVEKTHGLGEVEVKRNIESHLVPYEAMMADEPVETRYPKFLKERARLVKEKLDELAGVRET